MHELRDEVERAYQALKKLDEDGEALERVSKELSMAEDRLERTTIALAKVESELRQKAWQKSQAQAEAVKAHDLEIAKRQKTIRELGAQVEALNKALAGAKA